MSKIPTHLIRSCRSKIQAAVGRLNSVIIAADSHYSIPTKTSTHAFVFHSTNYAYMGVMQRSFISGKEWSVVGLVRPDTLNNPIQFQTIAKTDRYRDWANVDVDINNAELSGSCWSLETSLWLMEEEEEGGEGRSSEAIILYTDSSSVYNSYRSMIDSMEIGSEYRKKLNPESLMFLASISNLSVVFRPRESNRAADALVTLGKYMLSSEREVFGCFARFWSEYVKLEDYAIMYTHAEVLSFEKLRARFKLDAKSTHCVYEPFVSVFWSSMELFPLKPMLACPLYQIVRFGKLLIEKLDLQTAELPRSFSGVIFLHFFTEDERALEVLLCITVLAHHHQWMINKEDDFFRVWSRVWAHLELELFSCKGETIDRLPSYIRYLGT